MRELERLPRRTRERVAGRIRALAVEPRPPGARKLMGEEGTYRIRVGTQRVLYEIDDESCTVLVTAIRPRDQAYRRR